MRGFDAKLFKKTFLQKKVMLSSKAKLFLGQSKTTAKYRLYLTNSY